MNLKEAFRYQNFIDRTISSISDYLGTASNVTKTTQEHLRKKANSEADNETIDTTRERKIQYPVNMLVEFMLSIVNEKEKICRSITQAKNLCELDIDGSIAVNKVKQTVHQTLSYMSNIKPSERTVRGQAYKFNAEGNQVSYTYDVNEVSVIDFDRNKVKSIAKMLILESDGVSSKIDKIMVDTLVNYEAPYDVNDSLEDMIEQFTEKHA